jgi:apocytochrome f
MNHRFETAIASGLRRACSSAIVAVLGIVLFFASDLALPQAANAYPFWAQETAPVTPREATGRIVCANCHLANKPTKVEVPQAVLPDTVFKAVVEIPYDLDSQQILGDGSKGSLNVGAVIMLPEGFKIAPEDRIPDDIKEETEGMFYQQYNADSENVIIVGPLPGDQYQEIVFPVLSPDPRTDKTAHFGKYSVHVGGNRGRGQIYPTGLNSNNIASKATAAGTIAAVTKSDDGGYSITIKTSAGDVVEVIPPGPEPIVSEGQTVEVGEVITTDPNVGGFGQVDGEIVLQSAGRIQGMLAFFALVTIAQIFLVMKKKQIEKVQAAEMNF